jgi:hypothetical protein
MYCRKLTGSPVCGNNVTILSEAYYHCYNISGSPICGPNVDNMYYAYYGCTNLYGNMYMYSNNVSDMESCFEGRNNSNMLNIYVHNGSTTLNTLLINNTYSLVGAAITWTNNGVCYYNDLQNIYIYPVSNVAAELDAANNPK